jgi:hypothetical protein
VYRYVRGGAIHGRGRREKEMVMLRVSRGQQRRQVLGRRVKSGIREGPQLSRGMERESGRRVRLEREPNLGLRPRFSIQSLHPQAFLRL